MLGWEIQRNFVKSISKVKMIRNIICLLSLPLCTYLFIRCVFLIIYRFKKIIQGVCLSASLLLIFCAILTGIILNIKTKSSVVINKSAFILFSTYWIIGGSFYLHKIFDSLDDEGKHRAYFGVANSSSAEYWLNFIERITFLITLVTILSVIMTRDYSYENFFDVVFVIIGTCFLGISLPFSFIYLIIKYCWSFKIVIKLKIQDISFAIFVLFFLSAFLIIFVVSLFSIQMGLYLSGLISN